MGNAEEEHVVRREATQVQLRWENEADQGAVERGYHCGAVYYVSDKCLGKEKEER